MVTHSSADTLAVRRAAPADLPAVQDLLREAALPLDGVPADLRDFLVAERAHAIVGAIGLERYGTSALLRSAVVSPALRGHGVGEQLVRALMAQAEASGIGELILLTTTAMDWFPRFGFARVDRATIPEALHASAALRGACPASAIVMRCLLQGPRADA